MLKLRKNRSDKTNHCTRLPYTKQVRVIDYNFNMTVDKTDMDLKSIECIRGIKRNVKRYKKYFFHMLDMVVRNSYYLCQISTGKKSAFADY
ncbi:hypothetical protein HZH68_013962 [Vespula germanica]|uniref:PiggyBac transposable element-derived protein domain-containing protein n=1 Tax=Vespula germanica TaxID=30212 RepID=A0A834MU81_VESGE|nr:hypothetical protein HZH68_013962 [Vespula germanica]